MLRTNELALNIGQVQDGSMGIEFIQQLSDLNYCSVLDLYIGGTYRLKFKGGLSMNKTYQRGEMYLSLIHISRSLILFSIEWELK